MTRHGRGRADDVEVQLSAQAVNLHAVPQRANGYGYRDHRGAPPKQHGARRGNRGKADDRLTGDSQREPADGVEPEPTPDLG